MKHPETVRQHLRELSYGYPLVVDEHLKFFIARFQLPIGFNESATDIVVELPKDYPYSPPGLGGSYVYVRPGLRFRRRRLRDVHVQVHPKFSKKFSWLCYEEVSWDPRVDNLVRFMERIRTDLTNPRTE